MLLVLKRNLCFDVNNNGSPCNVQVNGVKGPVNYHATFDRVSFEECKMSGFGLIARMLFVLKVRGLIGVLIFLVAL